MPPPRCAATPVTVSPTRTIAARTPLRVINSSWTSITPSAGVFRRWCAALEIPRAIAGAIDPDLSADLRRRRPVERPDRRLGESQPEARLFPSLEQQER